MTKKDSYGHFARAGRTPKKGDRQTLLDEFDEERSADSTWGLWKLIFRYLKGG